MFGQAPFVNDVKYWCNSAIAKSHSCKCDSIILLDNLCKCRLLIKYSMHSSFNGFTFFEKIFNTIEHQYFKYTGLKHYFLPWDMSRQFFIHHTLVGVGTDERCSSVIPAGISNENILVIAVKFYKWCLQYFSHNKIHKMDDQCMSIAQEKLIHIIYNE